MAIQFSPRNGSILMCSFSQHEDELVSDGNMLKTRPVIVVSPSLQGRGKLLHVVPISLTAPNPVCPWHVEVPLACMPPAAQHKEGVRWAKCDMVVTVGWSRLDRYQAPQLHGRKVFQEGYLDLPTLVAVKRAIAHVFGIRPNLWEVVAAQSAGSAPLLSASQSEAE